MVNGKFKDLPSFDRLAKWLFASKDWAELYREFTDVSAKHSKRCYFNYYLVPHSWNDGLNEQVKDISRYGINKLVDTGSYRFLAFSPKPVYLV